MALGDRLRDAVCYRYANYHDLLWFEGNVEVSSLWYWYDTHVQRW